MTGWIYCWRSGLIGFGGKVPEGALPICPNIKRLRERVEARARHSRTTQQLLVPGIPEAENSPAAAKALNDFVAWISEGTPPSPGATH